MDIRTAVISFGVAVLVAMITQWRADARHMDLRNDREHERKSELVEQTLRRQREAIERYLTNVQDEVNRHRTRWAKITTQLPDAQAIKNHGYAENVNLVEHVRIEIDKLELLIIEPSIRSEILRMKHSIQKVAVQPSKPDWHMPNLPVLDGDFRIAQDNMVREANWRLSPPPPEKFWPFLT